MLRSCAHPIPIPKALKIPAARDSLHDEWAKLEGKHAWDLKAVRPKAQVIKEAKAEGRFVHFGSLMELCSIKNSQLAKEFWTYKGRLVFRGTSLRTRMASLQYLLSRALLHPIWQLLNLWMLYPGYQGTVEKIVTQ